MVCPKCHSSGGRRSRRRTFLDYLASVAGLVPWRCIQCEKRFHARSVALRNMRYARCGICGNLELQKISAEYVPGHLALLARMLALPALRCDPCRHKFFAVRPVLKEMPRFTSTSRDQAA
jgi:DNA-directed RNA polymerase subunit RPC12/RpoP